MNSTWHDFTWTDTLIAFAIWVVCMVFVLCLFAAGFVTYQGLVIITPLLVVFAVCFSRK